MSTRRAKPADLPGWPRWLVRDMLASFLGVEEATIEARIAAGALPPPRDGLRPPRWDRWKIEPPEPSERTKIQTVYFLRAASGPIKIGLTLDLDQRLRTLRAMNHEPLALLWFMDGSRHFEAALHRRFATYRLGQGEWFRPGVRLLRYLDERRRLAEEFDIG